MVSFYLFLPFLKINKTFRHIQVKHIILQSAVTFPSHSQESHKALSSNQKTPQGSHRSLPWQWEQTGLCCPGAACWGPVLKYRCKRQGCSWEGEFRIRSMKTNPTCWESKESITRTVSYFGSPGRNWADDRHEWWIRTVWSCCGSRIWDKGLSHFAQSHRLPLPPVWAWPRWCASTSCLPGWVKSLPVLQAHQVTEKREREDEVWCLSSIWYNLSLLMSLGICSHQGHWAEVWAHTSPSSPFRPVESCYQ